jgi:hypothetical protein
MRSLRGVALVAAAILVVISLRPTEAVTHAAAKHTAASPGCYGASCAGGDPLAEGCLDDALEIAGFQVTNGTYPGNSTGGLFYSRACHAAWGEYISTTASEYRKYVLYSQPFNGGSPEVAVFEDHAHLGHNGTTMADWDSSLKFCAHGYNGDPDTDETIRHADVACTRWR